jgi:uncharacterized membrane protein (UPF0127 family)
VPAPRFSVRNVTRHATLATSAWRAAGPWSRMVGLLGRAALAPGEGLHLAPCGSVHTFCMRFPIDVLYLDRDLRVVKTVPVLRPFRCSWGGLHVRTTLELPAGTIAASGTTVGDQVAFADIVQSADVGRT